MQTFTARVCESIQIGFDIQDTLEMVEWGKALNQTLGVLIDKETLGHFTTVPHFHKSI